MPHGDGEWSGGVAIRSADAGRRKRAYSPRAAAASSCGRLRAALLVLAVVVLGAVLPSAQAWAGTGAPVNVSLPAISGIPKDGSTLKASKGSWTGLAPITGSYQWLRCNASGGECVTESGERAASAFVDGATVA